VGFWRSVIEVALDRETRLEIAKQLAWIEKEPSNPRPYTHLAHFYRMAGKQDEALGLLLEAVRLDPGFVEAHVSLAEIYAIREDYRAAWRHARLAEQGGEPRAVELLERYGR
jgi:cytochrome c-type biogenesis protein CcmH/NrfG